MYYGAVAVLWLYCGSWKYIFIYSIYLSSGCKTSIIIIIIITIQPLVHTLFIQDVKAYSIDIVCVGS